MNIPHSVLLIAITAIITFILRAFPFLIFHGKKQLPAFVNDIAGKLPPAIIAVLVIYCLKGPIAQIGPETTASAIALAAVVLIHLWKRNTLISVAAGTIIYMLCIRLMGCA